MELDMSLELDQWSISGNCTWFVGTELISTIELAKHQAWWTGEPGDNVKLLSTSICVDRARLTVLCLWLSYLSSCISIDRARFVRGKNVNVNKQGKRWSRMLWEILPYFCFRFSPSPFPSCSCLAVYLQDDGPRGYNRRGVLQSDILWYPQSRTASDPFFKKRIYYSRVYLHSFLHNFSQAAST